MQRVIRLHPTAPRLALFQPADYRGSRTRDRAERLVRGPGSDRRGVDLQGERGGEGLSDRALDQRWIAPFRLCGVHRLARVLCVDESETGGVG